MKQMQTKGNNQSILSLTSILLQDQDEDKYSINHSKYNGQRRP